MNHILNNFDIIDLEYPMDFSVPIICHSLTLGSVLISIVVWNFLVFMCVLSSVIDKWSTAVTFGIVEGCKPLLCKAVFLIFTFLFLRGVCEWVYVCAWMWECGFVHFSLYEHKLEEDVGCLSLWLFALFPWQLSISLAHPLLFFKGRKTVIWCAFFVFFKIRPFISWLFNINNIFVPKEQLSVTSNHTSEDKRVECEDIFFFNTEWLYYYCQ